MSQYTEANTQTHEAGAAMGQHLRVTRSAGVLQLAGATDRGIGTLESIVYAAGDPVAVRLWTAFGTRRGVASEAIADGAYVYAAAAGKLATAGFIIIGRALEAAAGNGSVFEYEPLQAGPDGVAAVAALGSTQGDAAPLTARFNIISAADGTKGVIAPDLPIGSSVSVYNTHATNGLKVYPPTGGDINDGTTNAAVTIEGKTSLTLTRLDATTWAAEAFTANT